MLWTGRGGVSHGMDTIVAFEQALYFINFQKSCIALIINCTRSG